ncbi:hypothetical protein WOLCODRAFT_18691 [Wolfiporia cocos MD-104 SS10]|uniref:Uncharacterized protein n=1 Tax=Wolfiporia cocos (strain MD-104) TaxID=742152 RepID=A0A2H3JYQ1_WOLCO|nr:hypothetical protein WOLCODRAFT_18691 [Wolfiporia cocos MD-104 SS10]
MALASGLYTLGLEAYPSFLAWLPQGTDTQSFVGTDDHSVVGLTWNVTQLGNGLYVIQNTEFSTYANSGAIGEPYHIVGGYEEQQWDIRSISSTSESPFYILVPETNENPAMYWNYDDIKDDEPVRHHSLRPTCIAVVAMVGMSIYVDLSKLDGYSSTENLLFENNEKPLNLSVIQFYVIVQLYHIPERDSGDGPDPMRPGLSPLTLNRTSSTRPILVLRTEADYSVVTENMQRLSQPHATRERSLLLLALRLSRFQLGNIVDGVLKLPSGAVELSSVKLAECEGTVGDGETKGPMKKSIATREENDGYAVLRHSWTKTGLQLTHPA